MNKCLVTKLKAVVQNDNLQFFGKLKFHVNFPTVDFRNKLLMTEGQTHTGLLYTDDTLDIKILGSGYRCNENGESNPSGDYLSAGEYDVLVGDKYNAITRIGLPWNESTNWINHCYKFDFSQFEYCKNIRFIDMSSGGANITGNVTSLIKCTSLTEFTAYSIFIEGELLELYKGQYMEGRKSGTLTLALSNNRISYNGDSNLRTLGETAVRCTFFEDGFTVVVWNREGAQSHSDKWTFADGVWVRSDYNN